ncbi:hypothetical protein Tco_0816603 [Tanacetum coccineum]
MKYTMLFILKAILGLHLCFFSERAQLVCLLCEVCKGEKFKVLAVIVLESDKSVCSRSPCGDVTLRDLARKVPQSVMSVCSYSP